MRQKYENAPQEEKESESTSEEIETNSGDKEQTNTVRKILFDKLDRIIEEEKLYLDPDITRERLIKEIHISKNAFAQLIQTYTGTNFSGYINSKRLEYSIRLLRKYDTYTVEAVAMDSGFSNSRNFYRIFREKFGMTPSEYRNTLKQE